MPYSPGGVFSLVASYFANPGTTIRTEQHNPVFEDVGSALSQVLLRDGRAPMTGPLNMNGFAINNVVSGNSPSSVATLAQAAPIGAVIDFAGATAPAGWSLCYGQAVSRTTYSALFAAISTTYGAGDGSTTFNLPDLRGRIVAGTDNMGGVTANRLTPAMSSNTIGGTGGAANYQLNTGNLPPYTPAGIVPINDPGHAHFYAKGTGTTAGPGGSGPLYQSDITGTTQSAGTGITASFSGTPQGGSSASFNIIQPTIVMNKIIKVSYDV